MLEALFATLGEIVRGEPDAVALLPRLERALVKERRFGHNPERYAVLRLLKDRSWRIGKPLAMPIVIHLRRIDERFASLTEAEFEACRQRSIHQFAAALSCKCGAFGDRKMALSLKAFDLAAREGSRKPRSRAKG